MTIQGGRLEIDDRSSGVAIYTSPANAPQFAQLIYEALAQKLSGPNGGSFGLQFGYKGDGSFYAFLITGNGQYTFQRWSGSGSGSGSWTVLKEWTFADGIALEGSPNRLRVIADSTNISLYANDRLLAAVSNRYSAFGQIGLIVTTNGIQAAFGSVRVWSLAGTPLPTPTPSPAPTPTPSPPSTPMPTPTPSPTPTQTPTPVGNASPTATPLPPLITVRVGASPTPTPKRVYIPALARNGSGW